MLPKIPKPKTGKRLSKSGGSVTTHTYNPDTHDLDVTFHGNRTYRYSGVPHDKAASFRDAESQGTFLHKHIIGKHDATALKPLK